MIYLLLALATVESGGRANAVGDAGAAFGVLQIHECVVIDVNRFAGTNYTHTDAFEPEKAKAMAHIYLNGYVTETRLGRKPTTEDYARVWNGGPNGFKNPKTLKYWLKVQANLPPRQ